jgi:hypothetical protein
MSNGTTTDLWNVWFKRITQLSGLVIVFLIVLRHLTLDPYLYPILALMLGFPIAGWAEGLLKRGNGNEKDKSDGA